MIPNTEIPAITFGLADGARQTFRRRRRENETDVIGHEAIGIAVDVIGLAALGENPRRCQAGNPLMLLSKFAGPALFAPLLLLPTVEP